MCRERAESVCREGESGRGAAHLDIGWTVWPSMRAPVSSPTAATASDASLYSTKQKPCSCTVTAGHNHGLVQHDEETAESLAQRIQQVQDSAWDHACMARRLQTIAITATKNGLLASASVPATSHCSQIALFIQRQKRGIRPPRNIPKSHAPGFTNTASAEETGFGPTLLSHTRYMAQPPA